MSFNSGYDHQFCVVTEVARLMDNGYRCYLEHEIEVAEGRKVVVDILAIRNTTSILIEVGSLSPSYLRPLESRLILLKRLMPNVRVHHITQWKNWINTWELRQAEEDERFRIWRIKHHKEEREDIENVFGQW